MLFYVLWNVYVVVEYFYILFRTSVKGVCYAQQTLTLSLLYNDALKQKWHKVAKSSHVVKASLVAKMTGVRRGRALTFTPDTLCGGQSRVYPYRLVPICHLVVFETAEHMKDLLHIPTIICKGVGLQMGGQRACCRNLHLNQVTWDWNLSENHSGVKQLTSK